MTLGALDWQIMQIGLGAGLFTKTDKRFSSPPSLDIARDVRYEELGGIQARLPFGSVMGAGAIFGGGSLSNCRRLAVVNGELLVFTNTGLYSWNAQASVWVSRGTHTAITIDETPRFVTTNDQTAGDRAELNGTIVYTWFEASGVLGGNTYAAAIDKTTGSVLMSPTLITASASISYSTRLVALATKILLFQLDGGAGNVRLTVRALDPANPLAGVQSAATVVTAAGVNGASYDVVRVLGADQAVGAHVLAGAAQYNVFTVTAGLTVATAVKAGTSDGAIAVASRPSSGTQTHIFRSVNAGTQILGDVITTATLADVATGQVIGTFTAPINHVTACYRSVQTAGHFVCRVVWNARENSDPAPEIKSNTVDDAGTIGTQATFVGGVGVASRAFDYNGTVYVWVVFAQTNQAVSSSGAALQNTYFLYGEDGSLVAKVVPDLAGGIDTAPPRPTVAPVSGSTGYAWAGAKRRSLATATSTGFAGGRVYAARTLADVALTYDSNEARRVATLGRTAYISGGQVLAYDGVQLVECGFDIFGYSFAPTDAGAGTGSMGAGTYFYKTTFRYMNAQQESERSTSASIASVSIAAGTSSMSAPTGSGPLYNTRKASPAPAFEVWRTAANPSAESPFYLTNSIDPNASTNPNRYLPNAIPIAAYTDALADATLTTKEANPENGDVLEFLAPPPAKIIIATETRLFLAGVAGDPDRVWYSRERNDGEVASFHDALTIEVPPAGGSITSIWLMDGVLYVGRQYAIYALPGTGFDNTAGGQNFGPAQVVSLDVGPVSQEAQCLTPLGTVFSSALGYYLMDRGRGLRYIGAAVSSFDSDTVLSMEVLTSVHEVRVLTNNRMLVWTYTDAVDLVDAQTPGGMGQWSERTISDGLDAVLWNGGYVYLTSSGPKQEQASYSGLTYGVDLETSWIKLNGLQGYGKTGEIMILGEYRSAHLLRVRLARDYQYDGAGNVVYFDDRAWNPSPTTVGSALQVRHSPSASNGNCEAIKVRITAVVEQTRATLATAAVLPIKTSGTNWAATWSAANPGTPGSSYPGVMGNVLTMSIAFRSGAVAFDVRDHFTYNTTLGRWVEELNNIGVLVTATSTITVAQLEAAIAAGTKLATLQTADASPAKTIDVASYLVNGAYPTTAAGVAAIVPGGTFDHGWLCDDASGNLSPAFGGLTLTAGGAGIVYGDIGPSGTADRAIEFTGSPAQGQFSGGANFDVSGTDDLVVAWVGRWTALPTSLGVMFGKASAAFGNGWAVCATAAPRLAFTAGAGSSLGSGITDSAAFFVGSWHVGLAVVDRAAGLAKIGARSLAGVSAITTETGTVDGTSFANASNFFIGKTDWQPASTSFQLAALYIGKGTGVAAGLAAGLSSALATFASAFSGAAGFSGGAYASPTGEALKLTGIALRVGLKPGLYGRLPAAQKQ